MSIERSNVIPHPAKRSGSGNNEEPPMDLTARVERLENTVNDIKLDVAVIKSNYATKQDLSELRAEMHKSFSEQTRWIIIAMATLIAITTAVQRFTMPDSASSPIHSEQQSK